MKSTFLADENKKYFLSDQLKKEFEDPPNQQAKLKRKKYS